jgi:hypothetical protein
VLKVPRRGARARARPGRDEPRGRPGLAKALESELVHTRARVAELESWLGACSTRADKLEQENATLAGDASRIETLKASLEEAAEALESEGAWTVAGRIRRTLEVE